MTWWRTISMNCQPLAAGISNVKVKLIERGGGWWILLVAAWLSRYDDEFHILNGGNRMSFRLTCVDVDDKQTAVAYEHVNQTSRARDSKSHLPVLHLSLPSLPSRFPPSCILAYGSYATLKHTRRLRRR